ncbi:MAG: class I SAM-dependent RNA methyltransferase [Acidobacteriota bacterium]
MNESVREMPVAGERVRVPIGDLTSRGWGVGRTADGLVVMVRGAVPGDEVDARIREVHRGHVEAEIDALVVLAPRRCEPFCTHFGLCGGCALQQIPGAEQRRAKTERLRRLLAKFAGVPAALVEDARAVGPDTGFRNRMEFCLAPGPDGPILGLHEAGGDVFDLTECHLPHPDIVHLAHEVRRIVREHSIPVHDPSGKVEGLTRVDIRRAGGGAILITLRARGDISPAEVAPLAALTTASIPARGVVLAPGRARVRPPGPGEAGAGRPRPGMASPASPPDVSSGHVVAGEPEIRETLLGLEVALTGQTFIQTHAAGAEALYQTALGWLEVIPGGSLLDLYAGLGLLAQAGAGKRRRVVAVESSRAAVQAGRRAAARNRREVRFVCATAHRALASLAAERRSFPLAVANPPRAGLHRSIAPGLARLGVTRLSYISCDGATLARDVARLARVDLKLRRVVPFDLFPHTAGLEAVALFARTRPPARPGRRRPGR